MYRVGIIAASGKGYIGEIEDKIGKAIIEIMQNDAYKIDFYKILPNEQKILSDEMKNLCDNNNVDLIITTGRTGFSKRDHIPEAMLGRGISVIRKKYINR